MSDLQFQPWQFMGSDSMLPACAETELSMADYKRMGTDKKSTKRCGWGAPPFALNAEQFKKVLLTRAWQYLHGGGTPPESANANWQEVNRQASAHALAGRRYIIRADAPAMQHQMRITHIAAVQRAGGYLELVAAIAFRCWRLGDDSVTVGASLGIKPVCVRVHLQRLRDIARKLGYDVGKDHWTRKPKAVRQTRRKISRGRPVAHYPWAKAARILYKAGHTVADIARLVGFPKDRGNNAVRRVLMRQDVYQHSRVVGSADAGKAPND